MTDDAQPVSSNLDRVDDAQVSKLDRVDDTRISKLDRFDNAPISKLIGMQVEPGDASEAVVHLPIHEDLNNPMGRVHGGVYAVLADASMGIAFGRTLDADQNFATLDLHIHFIRAVRGPRLTAKAKVRQRGLRIGFVDCEITDHRGRLVATATCCCTILDNDLS